MYKNLLGKDEKSFALYLGSTYVSILHSDGILICDHFLLIMLECLEPNHYPTFRRLFFVCKIEVKKTSMFLL